MEYCAEGARKLDSLFQKVNALKSDPPPSNTPIKVTLPPNLLTLPRPKLMFLSKGQWTYGPTFCLSIDTHIRSKGYKVVYF